MNEEHTSYPMVFACDENYAMPLATALRSILDSNKKRWPLEFHIISDRFSEEMRKKVHRSLPKGSSAIRWIDVDMTSFNEFGTLSHISSMTYARFLLPSIFPDNVTKILYLDADLLVIDDLGPLLATDLEGAVLGAVLDGLDQSLKSGKPGLKAVPTVQSYFNAGVLLIDLGLWRQEMISEKALQYMRQNPQSPYYDQDALNVVCDGLWKRLDTRWNCTNFYENMRILNLDRTQRPGILHFTCSDKPWKAGIPNRKSLFYDKFRSRTCFAKTQKERFYDTLQWILYRFMKVFSCGPYAS